MTNYFRFSEQNQFDLKTITDFNNFCFPVRGDHVDYDRYRFVENPFASETYDYLYGVEKDGKYVAQMLTMPAPLSINGIDALVYWGQDYFVLEECRGEGIGKELAHYYLGKDYYIAVGFSPKSAVIHQKMGAKKIGYLDYYQKWASPLHRLKFLFQRGLKIKAKALNAYQFPDELENFIRITDTEQLFLPRSNWNANHLETMRDATYFKWRFLYKPDRYFVYQSKRLSSDNPCYLVVKPHFHKGVNWLKVVDYRFKMTQKGELQEILNAAENIRKQLNLFGVIISSSLKLAKEIIENNGFQQTRHEVILTTFPFKHQETDEDHNHFSISFADSDLDMHTTRGIFMFANDY